MDDKINLMLEIGKETTITSKNFRNLVTLLFGRHGNIGVSYFREDGKGVSSDDMFLHYLNVFKNSAKELFNEEELEEIQDDSEIHIATWQDGKGWIVDHSMTRKLLIWAAHNYNQPQPCVNCDVYKEKIQSMGEDNWAMNKVCQECITGVGWMNFRMKIE